MPVVARVGRECPYDVVPSQAGLHVGVVSEIEVIIPVRESVAENRGERCKRRRRQQDADKKNRVRM